MPYSLKKETGHERPKDKSTKDTEFLVQMGQLLTNLSICQKLWIMEHLLLPWLQWPLLIYEICMTNVDKLQRRICNAIQKWLRLHNSTTNICFYFTSSPCPLPIKSFTWITKSAKVMVKWSFCIINTFV